MTLDDLNDDDFDPRAEAADTGDSSDTSDDFNPRGDSSNPRTLVGTPIIKPPSTATQQSTPTRILPPPSLPPRDPSKISAAKVPAMANPFTAPPVAKDAFSNGLTFGNADFSLDELDPL